MNCADCFFGRKPGEEFSNACYRYPEPGRTAGDHWCGEYAPIKPNPNFAKPTLTLKKK